MPIRSEVILICVVCSAEASFQTLHALADETHVAGLASIALTGGWHVVEVNGVSEVHCGDLNCVAPG